MSYLFCHVQLSLKPAQISMIPPSPLQVVCQPPNGFIHICERSCSCTQDDGAKYIRGKQFKSQIKDDQIIAFQYCETFTMFCFFLDGWSRKWYRLHACVKLITVLQIPKVSTIYISHNYILCLTYIILDMLEGLFTQSIFQNSCLVQISLVMLVLLYFIHYSRNLYYFSFVMMYNYLIVKFQLGDLHYMRRNTKLHRNACIIFACRKRSGRMLFE